MIGVVRRGAFRHCGRDACRHRSFLTKRGTGDAALERWKSRETVRAHVPTSDSAGDVLLAQMVRYAANQWDSAARFSTRAGAIMTVGGGILVGSITLLTVGSPLSNLTRVIGWLLVGVSIVLAGWGVTSTGWKQPPNVDDTNLKTVLTAKAEALKQGLVLDYGDACRTNNIRLKNMRLRQDVALAILTAGTILIGLAYFASKP